MENTYNAGEIMKQKVARAVRSVGPDQEQPRMRKKRKVSGTVRAMGERKENDAARLEVIYEATFLGRRDSAAQFSSLMAAIFASKKAILGACPAVFYFSREGPATAKLRPPLAGCLP